MNASLLTFLLSATAILLENVKMYLSCIKKQVRMLNTGSGHTCPWFCFVRQADQHCN